MANCPTRLPTEEEIESESSSHHRVEDDSVTFEQRMLQTLDWLANPEGPWRAEPRDLPQFCNLAANSEPPTNADRHDRIVVMLARARDTFYLDDINHQVDWSDMWRVLCKTDGLAAEIQNEIDKL